MQRWVDYFSDELYTLGFLVVMSCVAMYLVSQVGGPVVPDPKPVIRISDAWSYDIGDEWQGPLGGKRRKDFVKYDTVQLKCRSQDLSQGNGSVVECSWQ